MPLSRSNWVAAGDISLSVVTILFLSGAVVLFARGSQYSADRSRCVENAHELGAALLEYANDHDEVLPPAERLIPGESCLVDERRTGAGVNIYTVQPGTQWNQVIAGYLHGRSPFQCPNDPTGLYKLAPALSYTPLVGPTALVDPSTCEQLNGVMGKNWGARLSSVNAPHGTALIFEMISPMTKDYQLGAGTIREHPWRVYASSTWCGVLEDSAVYPRREMLFLYDEEHNFQGPHLGALTVTAVDGHAVNEPLAKATGEGSDDCSASSSHSVFDRRHPLAGEL